MRTVLLALFSIGLASAADIPKGTHVLLRMVNSINTRTAAEGDRVYLETATPIAADGGIVVPSGSYVQGSIVHVKRSGKVSGRAELGIRLETLTLANGKMFKISPRLTSVDSGDSGQKVEGQENQIKQGTDYGTDAQRIAILAGSGAGIGAGVGAINDHDWTGAAKGAGIGAGIGAAAGVATAMVTRGKEVELRQGSTLDVIFERAISIE